MFDITLIHPMIVHFTIALFSLVVLLDILGLMTKKEFFHIASWINLLFAGASVIVTVVTGLLAEKNVPHVEEAHEIMETHETLGYFVLGSILLLLIWRISMRGKFPGKAAFLYIVIGLVGLGFMFTGAYYGGEMVYIYGVAVKAVPVSEASDVHRHDGDDGHAGSAGEEASKNSTRVEFLPSDTTDTSMTHPPQEAEHEHSHEKEATRVEQKMHTHDDGTVHEH